VVVEWCEARALSVDFCVHKDGTYYADKKLIKLSARASAKVQFHALLHECGHYLINENHSNHRYILEDSAEAAKRSLKGRLHVFDEEFEAWHRGWKLALRTGTLTKDDKIEFDRIRTDFLRTYLGWIKTPEEYVDEDDDHEAVRRR
jgi:hypothetical protein